MIERSLVVLVPIELSHKVIDWVLQSHEWLYPHLLEVHVHFSQAVLDIEQKHILVQCLLEGIFGDSLGQQQRDK